jgi:hypothetical protein
LFHLIFVQTALLVFLTTAAGAGLVTTDMAHKHPIALFQLNAVFFAPIKQDLASPLLFKVVPFVQQTLLF